MNYKIVKTKMWANNEVCNNNIDFFIDYLDFKKLKLNIISNNYLKKIEK